MCFVQQADSLILFFLCHTIVIHICNLLILTAVSLFVILILFYVIIDIIGIIAKICHGYIFYTGDCRLILLGQYTVVRMTHYQTGIIFLQISITVILLCDSVIPIHQQLPDKQE